MSNKESNPLIGRCPVCAGPEAQDGANDAYVASTMYDSDQLLPLVYSAYYEQNVCQLCKKQGEDFQADEVRDDDSAEKESIRQEYGTRHVYDPN